jgi:hypothetical protein
MPSRVVRAALAMLLMYWERSMRRGLRRRLAGLDG